MISATLGVVAAAAIAGLATDLELLVDGREIVAQGSASGFDGFDFSSDDLLPDVPFDKWGANAGGYGFVKSGEGSGSSSQFSTITSEALTAEGDSSASAFSDGNAYALGFAYSRYEVVFRLSSTARLRVQAELAANGEARSWVRIDEVGGARLFDEDASAGPRSIDEFVTLPAGDYEFQLRCDAGVTLNYEEGSGSESASYGGSLTVAGGCNEADLAEPFGVLDLADVQGFASAFLAGEASADIAAPFGVLDLADVQAFIGAFLAGCP